MQAAGFATIDAEIRLRIGELSGPYYSLPVQQQGPFFIGRNVE
jgi:hypothetical protein